VETHLDPVAQMQVPSAFPQVTSLFLDFVRSEPGAQQALLERARAEPDEVLLSLVTLGAVLLDVSAGAFHLSSEEMLDKVAAGIFGPHEA
jgi:hypothetical protein